MAASKNHRSPRAAPPAVITTEGRRPLTPIPAVPHDPLLDRADPLLTIEEAGRRLGIAPRTTRDWIKSGKLRPVVRFSGKNTRVPASSIEASIARLTTEDREPAAAS